MTNIEAKDRHAIIPASYLDLRDGDKILLQRRYNTGFEDGNYSLVAGHVDQSETFTQAMIREAKEESGVILKEKDIEVVHIMHKKAENNLERINAFFIAKEWSGEVVNMEPHKCDDLNWFDMSNLPENIIPEVKQALKYIEKNIFYSEIGWSN